jgi:Arc/MetJ-type ribon-helix-helix transcriptional regulator
MAEPKKKAGRPQGAPSQVLPVRIPVDLVQRLNRYLDLAETRTGLRSNRTEALRQALVYWLDAKEKALGISRKRPAAKKRAKA